MVLFKSVELTHYYCYCGHFESRVLTQCSCCWAPLLSRVPAHYSCCWGPLEKKSNLLAHCICSWGALWRQSTELWRGSENSIWADNVFFTKNEKYLRAKYLEGDPWKGRGRGKCLACLPLKTPMCITPTMILYENTKSIKHVLLHPICVLSHLMCAWTL